jgi:hypothetical protein
MTMDLKGIDLSGSRQGPMAGSYKYGIESSVP